MQIYVNGAKKVLQFEGQPLTHDGAVILAGRDRGCDNLVTYSHLTGESGVLKPSCILKVTEGMSISVSDAPIVETEEA